MKFDLEYLEELAKIVSKNNLGELTLENENELISLRRGTLEPAQAASFIQAQESAVMQQNTAVQPAKKQEPSKEQKKGKPVYAPMTGTFYASPSPEEPPFVKKGDNIAMGQTVCIIEAMKLMNEIEAEISGVIAEICAKDGQTVDAGQVLMYIE